MTIKKGFLYKVLGGLVAVCGGAVIGAIYVGNRIEQYYTPTFDAKRLENSKKMLAISIEARAIARTAAWDQCKELVLADPATKPLLDKMQFYEEKMSHPESLFTCLQAGIKFSSACDAVDARVDERINKLPDICEIDTRIQNIRQEISDLRRDSIECVQWQHASKSERVKKNWNMIRNNNIQSVGAYYSQLVH